MVPDTNQAGGSPELGRPELMAPQRRRSLTAAILSGMLLGTIGLLGWGTGQPLLIPSLGPSIYLHTLTPQLASARAGNTFLGHLIGLSTGLAAVYLTGAHTEPSVMGSEQLTWPRIAAAVIALVSSVGTQAALKIQHPPAAATTLLVALGAIDPTWHGVFTVLLGISLLTILGEGVRRFSQVRNGWSQ